MGEQLFSSLSLVDKKTATAFPFFFTKRKKMIAIYGELHSSKNGKSIINIKGKPMLISKKVVRDSERGLLTQMALNRYKFISEAKNLSKPLKIVFKPFKF